MTTITGKILKEDIIRIAKSIGKSLTDKEVEKVLEEYPAWEKQDPTATWNLIIEDIVYFVISERDV
jgi:Ca2+-binding EF-hand superfamily protein